MAFCGWCQAHNDECCGGRFAWCTHPRCPMTVYEYRVGWNDAGKTWCYDHGREDWCANKAKREGIQMSKVIDEAQELLDLTVQDVLQFGRPGDKARARTLVEMMSIFVGKGADDLARESVARVQGRASAA